MDHEKVGIPNPLATVCDYYASCLPSNPKAIDYLKRHALHYPALSNGIADRSLPFNADFRGVLIDDSFVEIYEY